MSEPNVDPIITNYAKIHNISEQAAKKKFEQENGIEEISSIKESNDISIYENDTKFNETDSNRNKIWSSDSPKKWITGDTVSDYIDGIREIVGYKNHPSDQITALTQSCELEAEQGTITEKAPQVLKKPIELLDEKFGKKPVNEMTTEEIKEELVYYIKYLGKNYKQLSNSYFDSFKITKAKLSDEDLKQRLIYIREKINIIDGATKSSVEPDGNSGEFTQQGKNCWFLSSVNCLSKNQINNIIGNGPPWNITFPGVYTDKDDGKKDVSNMTVEVTLADLYMTKYNDIKLVEGDADVEILEVALYKLITEKLNLNLKQEIVDSGRRDGAGFNLLIGDNYKSIGAIFAKDLNTTIGDGTICSLLNLNNEEISHYAYCAGYSNLVKNITLDQKDGTKVINIKTPTGNRVIYADHSYKITSNKDGTYNLTNPWDSSESFTLDEGYIKILFSIDVPKDTQVEPVKGPGGWKFIRYKLLGK